MIQIESVRIVEFRGIRDLTLRMGRLSFAVSGPNGSGKSGVVDAIQFALTGEVGRLKGSGTGELTLSQHGPHVDRRGDPAAAFVHLSVYIPRLKKTASIRRTIKTPKSPEIVPGDPDVMAVFNEVARHPEITLSRREIIKFILTEATRRSRDVQILLKLDDIDQRRATLKTAENKLSSAYAIAKAQVDAAESGLKRHLDLPVLKIDELLLAVNKRRDILGLSRITELTKDTSLSEGVAEAGSSNLEPTKEIALRELQALSNEATSGFGAAAKAAVASILDNMAKLDADPELLASIKARPLIEMGLELVEGPSCPLCDTFWEIEALRTHLQEKLDKSLAAAAIHKQLLQDGLTLSTQIVRIVELVGALTRIPEVGQDTIGRFGQWSGALRAFGETLASVEGVLSHRERFKADWSKRPASFTVDLDAARDKVAQRPDTSATGAAQSFLIVAQDRLHAVRSARRDAQERATAATRGRAAYKLYCDVTEGALMSLYAEVEDEFGKYYRFINQDDEGEFKAKFEAVEGKLGLLVDFHKKGMFPPGAYHSEGHQDGMGVCLYLALMRRVMGPDFILAVLDDVVMSVDSQHRKLFCKLLKTHFPNSQFIITTHDQVWARQLRSEGVVGSKSSVAFHTWTVETGPVLDEIGEIWDLIDADLQKNEVPTAAGRLRRHLEYVAREVADEIGAEVKFKADAGYDMGELLSAVIGRQGDLLKAGARAARSWGDADAIARVEALQLRRKEILEAYGGEQWVINKAIHYNEWADLSKNDFRPVVTAFKELLGQFRCSKPQCRSWLSLTPRAEPVDLRCACGAVRLNLNEK